MSRKAVQHNFSTVRRLPKELKIANQKRSWTYDDLFLQERRGRDSNPGSPCGDSGFQDRCIRPLCHLSEAVTFENNGLMEFDVSSGRE